MKSGDQATSHADLRIPFQPAIFHRPGFQVQRHRLESVRNVKSTHKPISLARINKEFFAVKREFWAINRELDRHFKR
jgi:hypothetical protein